MAKEIEIKYARKKENISSSEGFMKTNNINSEDLIRKYIRNIRIFSLFLFLFSLLTAFAIISYSPRDEFILDLGIKEFIKIIGGNPELLRKAKEVNNLLGPFGAIVSNFFVNNTFGYFSLVFCVVGLLISGKLYFAQKLSYSSIRLSIIIVSFGVLLSSILGCINQVFQFSIPIGFIGYTGIFISQVTINFLGKFGSVVLLFFLLFFLAIYTFDLKLDKLFVKLYEFEKLRVLPLFKSTFSQSKELQTKAPSENKLEFEESNLEEQDVFDNETIQSLRFNFNPKVITESFSTISMEASYPSDDESTDTNENVNSNDNEDQGLIDLKPLLQDKENSSSNEINADLIAQNKLIVEVEEPIQENKLTNTTISPFNPISTTTLDEKISYIPPPIDLFIDDENKFQVNEDELKYNAQLLQEKLETFKIFIQNLKVIPGPVVTQYEFVPAPGIKISKIQSLADDIALALKAKGIRIIAPVPGRGTVGIEIPNKKPLVVRFGNCLKNARLNPNYKLPIIMGKTISGEIFIDDLSRMPHLLIAGATGSGKSVGINTIISSLIYYLHPQNLKLVIIDPKKVELSHYQTLLYHYLAVSPEIEDAIFTDPLDAVLVLKALVAEMQFRYDLLASVQQRNIVEYNKKVKAGFFKDNSEFVHKPMPYIVVIIDELADLMLTTGKEIESLIIRLAQLARAVGIHLVVATQRPSVDIITGLIKANFPARISYLVASRVDSRTIIDNIGAEQLLGNGDMLFLPNGSPIPIRLQNAFLTTEEVEAICQHIGSQKGFSKPYYLPVVNENKSNKDGIKKDGLDDLFEKAAYLVVQTQQASVSLIQRRLKVGYNRAGRIMDELEALGIVGPFDGSKGRAVKIANEEELRHFLREKL